MTRQRPVAVAGVILGLVAASIGLRYSRSIVASFVPAVDISRSLQRTGNPQTTTAVEDDSETKQALAGEEQHDSSFNANPFFQYTKAQLKEMYTSFVETEVHFNNWKMGCNDLQMLAPHLKAITNRLAWDSINTGKARHARRHTIIDVGANNGDDAQSILGSFQSIRGMCWRWGSSLRLISIEPSPEVFCEMIDTFRDQQQQEEVHFINVALSSQTGNLIFRDPGNEGGKIVDNNYSELGLMTEKVWSNVTQCHLPAEMYKNQSIDLSRYTVVPTYTLDLLMESLDKLGKLGSNQTNSDDIFVLKIDTEGHDGKVLLGAKELLRQKKIEFVIFETLHNSLLKTAVIFMSSMDYECYLLGPKWLVPLHTDHHWYFHLDNYTRHWWGNALCGKSKSKTMSMLWRSYHSDDMKMTNSYEILHQGSSINSS